MSNEEILDWSIGENQEKPLNQKMDLSDLKMIMDIPKTNWFKFYLEALKNTQDNLKDYSAMNSKEWKDVLINRGKIVGSGFLLSFINQCKIEYKNRVEDIKEIERK